MTEPGCCGCNANSNNDTPDKEQSPHLPANQGGFVSEFSVPGMDCPSEERMIRMALDDVDQTLSLQVDIPGRQVRIYHDGDIEPINAAMTALGFGATLTASQPVDAASLTQAQQTAADREQQDARVLRILLAVNAVMFVLELTVGWLAQSTGLIADSLDMFADAAVYGLALYAVGRSSLLKVRAAHVSGWLQLLLAVGALLEVGRRFWFGSEPVSALMMGFGLVALAANVYCLLLIARNRDNGAHMKASWIFSANDVIANSGVILAGVLVALTGSRYPDLIIGLLIGLIVLNGARRILQLKA